MKIKVEGFMRLFVVDEKTRKILQDTGFLPNMIVGCGKEFVLDETCNYNKWNGGSGISAVALGYSTDTNTGILGPNAGRDVAIGGAWDGVSINDFRLSDEGALARSSIVSKSRVGTTITLFAQFTDSQLIFGSNICKIREAGIFLHATTPPTADPRDIPAQKPYAMIARRLYYGTNDPNSPTTYIDQPFYKVEGSGTLMFQYKIMFG